MKLVEVMVVALVSFDCTNTCHFELIGHKSHDLVEKGCSVASEKFCRRGTTDSRSSLRVPFLASILAIPRCASEGQVRLPSPAISLQDLSWVDEGKGGVGSLGNRWLS